MRSRRLRFKGRCATVRHRVFFQNKIAQPRLQHIRVDLGRGDTGMTEQRLNHPQFGTVGQQMCGKGLPLIPISE